MRSNQFFHTITVIRFIQTSQNTLGEPNGSSSGFTYSSSSGATPVNEIPARIEEYEEKTQYRESNIRVSNSTLIYLPPQYLLQDKDWIYWGSKHKVGTSINDYIGIVSGINPAYRGNTNTLDHWEVIIENP